MSGAGSTDFQAERQKRRDARRRDRGGIFKPLEKNSLMDVLMSRRKSGRVSPKLLSSPRGPDDSSQPRKKAARKSKTVKDVVEPGDSRSIPLKKTGRSKLKGVSTGTAASEKKTPKAIARRPRLKTQEQEAAKPTRKALSKGLRRKREAVSGIDPVTEKEEHQSSPPPMSHSLAEAQYIDEPAAASKPQRKRVLVKTKAVVDDVNIPTKGRRPSKKATSSALDDITSATVNAQASKRGGRDRKPVSYAELSDDEDAVIVNATVKKAIPLRGISEIPQSIAHPHTCPVTGNPQSTSESKKRKAPADDEEQPQPLKERKAARKVKKRPPTPERDTPEAPTQSEVTVVVTALNKASKTTKPRPVKRKPQDEENQPVTSKKRKLKAVTDVWADTKVKTGQPGGDSKEPAQSGYVEQLVPLNDHTNEPPSKRSRKTVNSKGTHLVNVPSAIRDLVAKGTRRWTVFVPPPASDEEDDPMDLLR